MEQMKIHAAVFFGVSLACLMCLGAEFDDGKYKIVVRIDNSVPAHLENNIVTHLKSFFTLTSSFINGATEKLTWFEEIVIVFPNSWNKSSLPSWNDVRKTDVIVTHDERVKYPFTQQSQGCEHQGDVMYIPDGFLSPVTDEDFAKRILAKAWAQLQYGVFEEHGWDNDVTYPKQYWSNGKLENTSCTFGNDNCKSETDGCDHQSSSSITYDPKTSTKTEFCNKSTHDYEAPNRQNILCNYRSVKDVIMQHPHLSFKNRTTSYTENASPRFKTVKQGGIHIIIIVDASDQMDNAHPEFQRAIANFILHEIPLHSFVSIIEHKDDGAELITNATEITADETREEILDKISTEVSGSPSIDSAISIAKELHDENYQTILLLPVPDEHSDLQNLLNDYKKIEVYLFYLATSQPTFLLKTENIHYFILPTPSHFFTAFNSAFSKFLQKYYPRAEKILTVSNELLVNKDKTFYVDSNITNLIIVVMSSVTASIDEVVIIPPKSNPVLRTHSESCAQDVPRGISICKIPHPETGFWRVSVITSKLSQDIYLDIRVQCTSCVFIESWLSNYYVTKATPNIPLIYSQIHSNGITFWPITDIHAEITHMKTKKQQILQLFDDGKDPDILAGDEIFSSNLQPVTNAGWYSVVVITTELSNVQRLSSAGWFYFEDIEHSTHSQFQLPNRILDLRVEWTNDQKHTLKLIWAATNNESTYDVRWSTNRRNLQNNFDSAQKLIPDDSNLTDEDHTEKIMYITRNNFNSSYCFALKAINHEVSGLVSNIACIKHAKPALTEEPSSSKNPTDWTHTAQSSSSKVFIIFSVATALSLLSLFIVAVTVCLLLTRYKLVRKRGRINLEETKALSRKNPEIDDTDV